MDFLALERVEIMGVYFHSRWNQWLFIVDAHGCVLFDFFSLWLGPFTLLEIVWHSFQISFKEIMASWLLCIVLKHQYGPLLVSTEGHEWIFLAMSIFNSLHCVFFLKGVVLLHSFILKWVISYILLDWFIYSESYIVC